MSYTSTKVQPTKFKIGTNESNPQGEYNLYQFVINKLREMTNEKLADRIRYCLNFGTEFITLSSIRHELLIIGWSSSHILENEIGVDRETAYALLENGKVVENIVYALRTDMHGLQPLLQRQEQLA